MSTEEKLGYLLWNVEALVVKQDAPAEQQETSKCNLGAMLKKLKQVQEETRHKEEEERLPNWL